jgi:7-carboxy-7-deazaguanine synthase (Cx14CxxC type)
MYLVKEIFHTLQGEGAQTGRPAVFCRFAGCNLWSGREPDREGADCKFCDTDFVGTDGPGGGRFKDASALAGACAEIGRDTRFVVLTGGEPMLQVDQALIDAMHAHRFVIAIETNGTLAVPTSIDWICVSPKAGTEITQRTGHELKFVFPQADLEPTALESLDFEHYFLQPMDGPDQAGNTTLAIAYCKAHPTWRLSLQTQKLIDIP